MKENFIANKSLYEICKISIDNNIKILESRCNQYADIDTLRYPSKHPLKVITNSLISTTSSCNQVLNISFTILAVRIFAGIMMQLTNSASIFAAFKGKSSYMDHLNMQADVFFNSRNHKYDYKYEKEEYLIDFYASNKNSKLSPILTMESEASTSFDTLEFHDLDKLLSVSSPRRVYFGRANLNSLKIAEEIITSRFDCAHQSQILLRGDEVQIILLVDDDGDKNKYSIRQYTYDSNARMRKEVYQRLSGVKITPD